MSALSGLPRVARVGKPVNLRAFRQGVLLVATLILSATACSAELTRAGDVPRNVLFVGNSFTYYNNGLHHHYRALLGSALPGVASEGRARILTISGGRLAEHRGGLQSMLAAGNWDVVVLQGYSRGPIDDATAGEFREAARDYAKLIRKSGAEPVFFMTWAYTGEPDMTGLLYAAYTGIGDELGAQVVPVGLAFATVTTERPDIVLRIADAKHPTVAGTYLAACTFFAALQGQSPVGIDYTAGLDDETARYLQDVAWQAMLRSQP
jgi:hypothetical protein